MRGRGKKIRLGGQKRSTLDWVGETPRCQKFTCKSSQLPPLFSSVFMVFPPPVLSSPPASCLLTSFPLSLVCLPHNLPASLSLSVLPCLLSSCIAPPAPWCSTDNQNSARTHTRRARRHPHLQTHTHTHTQGDTHPPLPAAPTLSHIFPLQTRNTLQPLVCQRFIKRHCQHYITTVFCIYTPFDTTYESL